MEMDCGVPRAREALDALLEALDYALRSQLRLRLPGVLHTYQLLAEEPDRNLPLAALIGWCVEMAECYHLVIDDMVDQSPIRRGRPALHTRPDISWRAIFDAVLFEKAACFVLKQRLGSHRILRPLLELFDECNFRCMLGEMFDVLTTAKTSAGQQRRQPSFDRYWAAGIFKSSAFGLELPIRAGMYAAGVEDKSLHHQAKEACVALGQIYMARNDYNDCFSCPTLTGKVGTDIVEHKHTWLLITALKLASPEQVEHIQAHIGRGSPGGPDEAAVKAVYKELNIQEHFMAYEEQSIRELDVLLDRMPRNLAEAFRLQRTILLGPDT
ncbi:farnesyl pyrophosphate synthase-like [Haemaphysalis longicornis]